MATLSLFSGNVHAGESSRSDATTDIALTSDRPNTVLLHEVRRSIGGKVAVRREPICWLPCTAKVDTEAVYIVKAPGMSSRRFYVPDGSMEHRLHVTGASQPPKILMWIGVVVAQV
ncbi:MAG: hypothetical protein FWD69_14850 [Polyangiaceae bacterium]|nr:hypothetical protein [Polyangiaceae bacterium]